MIIDIASIFVTAIGLFLLASTIWFQDLLSIAGVSHYFGMVLAFSVILIGTLMHIYVHLRGG